MKASALQGMTNGPNKTEEEQDRAAGFEEDPQDVDVICNNTDNLNCFFFPYSQDIVVKTHIRLPAFTLIPGAFPSLRTIKMLFFMFRRWPLTLWLRLFLDTYRLPSSATHTVRARLHSSPGSSTPLRPPFSLFEISEGDTYRNVSVTHCIVDKTLLGWE